MVSTNLKQLIEHPEMLNKDTLYELRMQLARFPYSQTLRVLYLKNLFMLRDASFGDELRKSVLYVTDRSALFYIIEGNNYSLASMRAAEEAVEQTGAPDSPDRTLALINAFLSTVPDEQSDEQTAGFDYSTDYTTHLLDTLDEENTGEGGEEQPQLRGIELIDGFIEESDKRHQTSPLPLPETPATTAAKPAEEDDDDSCFTETLAKIYIKQQRYEKAVEIIKKLSLKYPKKNAYFADQIRFLDKLIINAKSK
jgi:hypothetical protein